MELFGIEAPFLKLWVVLDLESRVLEFKARWKNGAATVVLSPLTWKVLGRWFNIQDPPEIPAPVRMWVGRCGPLGLIWVPAHDVAIWPPS